MLEAKLGQRELMWEEVPFHYFPQRWISNLVLVLCTRIKGNVVCQKPKIRKTTCQLSIGSFVSKPLLTLIIFDLYIIWLWHLQQNPTLNEKCRIDISFYINSLLAWVREYVFTSCVSFSFGSSSYINSLGGWKAKSQTTQFWPSRIGTQDVIGTFHTRTFVACCDCTLVSLKCFLLLNI